MEYGGARGYEIMMEVGARGLGRHPQFRASPWPAVLPVFDRGKAVACSVYDTIRNSARRPEPADD